MADSRVGRCLHDLSSRPVPGVRVPALLGGGLLLLLLAVPFHSVLLVPGISVVRAIGFFLAPLWLIWLVAALGVPRGPWTMSRRNVSLIIVACALICSVLVSLLYAPPSPIFVTSLGTVVFGLVLAVTVSTLIRSDALLRRAHVCLALGGAVAGGLVIAQFMAPQLVAKALGQHVFVEVAAVRATGPFRDPNYAAFTLTVLACLSFYLALAYRRWWKRVALYAGVAVQSVAILLTFSRAGYMVFGLVALAVLWRERRRLRLWKAVLAGMLGLGLAVMLGGGVLGPFVSRAGILGDFLRLLREDPSQARQLDLSLWYRLHLTLGGVKMAAAHFPIGVGWENFRFHITQYSPEVVELGAHNAYVGIAAELGLFGFVTLACFLWLLWRSTGALCRGASGETALLARGTRYALLTVLAGGMFLGVLHEATVWALIGLIMAHGQVASKAAAMNETGTTGSQA